ncbi:hypothetical protein Barb7_00658 [Bacteroidales bacterium Barb7]|nr:hypothetical protein Barb7_00658 [Bacteroidales bacterium Barb7]
MERTTSFFMVDSSDSDKKELVIDFFLSWTLRCAGKDGEIYENELLSDYCRRILSVLLFGNADNINDYTVKSVKTWKQWKDIDLHANVCTL